MAEPPRSRNPSESGEPAAFIRDLVKDPGNVPDVMLLYGYVGASSEPEHDRLYLSPDLASYVEVPRNAILHRVTAPLEQDPHGGVTLWVKKDAALIQKLAPAAAALASYFAGALQAGQGGAGTAAGVAGAQIPVSLPQAVCLPQTLPIVCQHSPPAFCPPPPTPHCTFPQFGCPPPTPPIVCQHSPPVVCPPPPTPHCTFPQFGCPPPTPPIVCQHTPHFGCPTTQPPVCLQSVPIVCQHTPHFGCPTTQPPVCLHTLPIVCLQTPLCPQLTPACPFPSVPACPPPGSIACGGFGGGFGGGAV
jgi:hypothetical protein